MGSRDGGFDIVPIRIIGKGAICAQDKLVRCAVQDTQNAVFYVVPAPLGNFAISIHTPHVGSFKHAGNILSADILCAQLQTAIDHVPRIIQKRG